MLDVRGQESGAGGEEAQRAGSITDRGQGVGGEGEVEGGGAL